MGGLHCTYYYDDPANKSQIDEGGADANRARAAEMIADGAMTGYLAYDRGEVVGWCNAGKKRGYQRLCADKELWTEGDDENALSIVCFTIAPAMRGQGIATALLRHVCEQARKQGYAYVEGYPSDKAADCFAHYHGPMSMFLACGFEPLARHEWYTVVRKTLMS